MRTQLFILLICCIVVSARECYQCVGHEDCLRPKNVTCDHEDFGCAKTIYDHEPFIKKVCFTIPIKLIMQKTTLKIKRFRSISRILYLFSGLSLPLKHSRLH